MKKQERDKMEEFVRAELALGGLLRDSKMLVTHDKVTIDLPSTTTGRRLINNLSVQRTSCSSYYHLAAKQPFDKKRAGRRVTVYMADPDGYTWNSRTNDSKRSTKIVPVLQIVTPCGVFSSQCGDVFTTVEKARAHNVKWLREKITKLERDHAKEIAGYKARLKKAATQRPKKAR